ncbi:MAG: hypothetical protein V2A61_06440, partial [Calditrichota bacterium]
HGYCHIWNWLLATNYGFDAYAWGLHKYDISDPSQPVIAGWYISTGYATHIVIDRNTAFIIEYATLENYTIWDSLDHEDDYFTKLKFINVANPSRPSLIGHYLHGGIAIAINGTRAVLTGGFGGAAILNISNLQRPRYLGGIEEPTGYLAVDEACAYIILYPYEDQADENLYIYDLSNPAEPVLLSESDTGAEIYDIKKAGNFIYLANWVNGLTIYDVSDPEHPARLSVLDDFIVVKLDIQGIYAYLLARRPGDDETRGLSIVDISNPEEPTEVSFLQTAEEPYYLDVEGDFAAITTFDRRSLRLLDVSDPENPEEVGFIEGVNYFYDVALAGTYAFVAGGNHFDIYDCSGAMGIPLPPEWIEIPDRIEGSEADTIEFDLLAMDPNGDDIELSLRRNGLPEAAEFTDLGGGSGRFYWITNYEDAS